MSKNEQQANPRDLFTLYQQNVDKFFSNVKQSVPQYHQSITNVQQEYLRAIENMVDSALTIQREFVKKSGMTTNVPDTASKFIRDTTEEVTKAATIQNQITLATIDAAQQNIKTFNDNAKSFADLNKNIVESWITTFTPRTN